MNNKKSSRTMINIIGLPFMVSMILLGGYFFAFFIHIVIYLGFREYVDILKKHSLSPSVWLFYLGQFLLLLYSLLAVKKGIEAQNWFHGDYFDHWYNLEHFLFGLLYIGTFMIILIMINEIFKNSSKPLYNVSTSLFGFIWIGFFINSLIFLRLDIGAILTLVVFISLWMCDTCAFFFGKHFGKSKIMPSVSPNKTILGSVSGLLGSIIFLLFLSYMNYIELNYVESFLLGLITGGISQFGDFFESLLKRELNIKDTSDILRGHGGVLDRFDSLSIISPLLLYFFYLIK